MLLIARYTRLYVDGLRVVTRPQIARDRRAASVSLFSASTDDARVLYDKIREWRKQIAIDLERPVQYIFSNDVIERIVQNRPKSIEEFKEIKGIGPKRVVFGEQIVEIVQKHDMDPHSVAIWSTMQPIFVKPEVVVTNSTKKARRVDSMKESELSQEQLSAAMRALEGNNLFITGSAGTGKSHLLSYVIQELQYIHGDDAVAVTAPTGVAAINIGGSTIHGFAGIGLGLGDRAKLLQKVKMSASSLQRWQRTKALIIDEISMLDRDLFEFLDQIARNIKKSELPFGGIQIIVVGDFFQLPPVVTSDDRKFCFESEIWEAAGLHLPSRVINLREIKRQDDLTFIDILNEIRLGKLSNRAYTTLNQCHVSKKSLPTDGIIPTKLYCYNRDVDRENTDNLDRLPGSSTYLEAKDDWLISPKPKPDSVKGVSYLELAEKFIPKELELKIGAQVMLTRNKMSSGLVNGSRGTVVRFLEGSIGEIAVEVKFDNGLIERIGRMEHTVRTGEGLVVMTRRQVPLKLAWAVTVHKSQGVTLSRAELMLANTFDYGQAYVALSRVRNLEALWLTQPITSRAVRAHPSVLRYFENAFDDSR